MKTLLVSFVTIFTTFSYANDSSISHYQEKNAFENLEIYKSKENTKGCTDSRGWNLNYIKFKNSVIRTGIYRTDSNKAKGNVMYLQGLGDSMMNHAKLFNSLTSNGYNVIAFDYMGQGCSSGTMNGTSISNINKLSKKVWNLYVKTQEKKKLIGWSTGGLAAYRYANKFPNEVKSIALIAPGISPKVNVGESMMITEKSLTQVKFSSDKNPHVDPIKPKSPLHVLAFAADLKVSSLLAEYFWEIEPQVKGHVFLSDRVDTYVDPDEALRIVKNQAPHFTTTFYENTGALHELDNEIEPGNYDNSGNYRYTNVSGHLRKTILELFED